MGTNATVNPVLINVFALIGLSILLAAVGVFLHKRGKLRARGPALIWAILTVLPLFGAGAFMFVKHEVEHATGELQSGVNEPPVRSAP